MKRIQAITEDNTKDKKKQNKNKKNNKKKQAKKPETKKKQKKTNNKNKPKNQKQKKNKNKTMGITRPKANKPMSKRRRTKYNDKNFHVQYFITAPKQQSNNAKQCQHQNNVAGGLGRGLGPLGPQSPGLGPGSWRQEGVFFLFFFVSGFLACFFFLFLFLFFIFLVISSHCLLLPVITLVCAAAC